MIWLPPRWRFLKPLYSSNQTRSSKSTLRSDWPDAIRCPDFFVLRHCSPNYQEVTTPETINLRVAFDRRKSSRSRGRDRQVAARRPLPKTKMRERTKALQQTRFEVERLHAVLSRRSFMRRRKPCAKAGWTLDSLPVRSLAQRRVGRFLSVQTKAPSRTL